MWFGALNGAVIFDGHTWTKADVPTSFVRQIIEGPRGRMFVGGEDVLGYLEPAPAGGWRFVSLLDRIPADAKPIGLSRRVVRLGEDVFIGGDRRLFRVRGDDVRTWAFDPARRNTVDVVNGEVFLLREGEGILRLQGEDWKPWVTPPGMERRQFAFLLPADGAVALLALGNEGLFRLDAEGKATRWGEAARTLAGGAAVLRRSSVARRQLRVRHGECRADFALRRRPDRTPDRRRRWVVRQYRVGRRRGP